MRIVHISTTDLIGGAGKAAFDLHQAMRSRGIDSWMIVQRKLSSDPYVISPQGLLQRFFAHAYYLPDYIMSKLFACNDTVKFSAGSSGWATVKMIDDINPDIVNLHWINSGMLSIKTIGKIQQKLVWTMHDMWPFTGGCHHSNKCTQYVDGCYNCPQLKYPSENDLSNRIYQNKKRSWSSLNFHLVVPSTWMAELAEKSTVLQCKSKARVIANLIDTETWASRDKESSRKILGLPMHKKVILFGAAKLSDRTKGFSLLYEAFAKLKSGENYLFISFGAESCKEIIPERYQYRTLGYIADNELLATIYSAADLFIAPSLYESFGKVVAESMACGTPVVTFDVSGQKDIIDHKINGYLAEPYNTESLRDGVEWVLDQDSQSLSQAAANKVKNSFSNSSIIRNYQELYNSLLYS